ncbi:unnamed protein product [Linum trigynum]|uniref:Uncharacterized protein n=1 Tax=Linum trigynum TaxID=586398 RepID=A0AAV2GAK7_9ROSI
MPLPNPSPSPLRKPRLLVAAILDRAVESEELVEVEGGFTDGGHELVVGEVEVSDSVEESAELIDAEQAVVVELVEDLAVVAGVEPRRHD